MIQLPTDQRDAHRLLKSLGRFAVSPDVAEVRDWLKAELERLDAASRDELDHGRDLQMQGARQVLAELFKHMETAEEKAEKIREILNKR